MTGGLGRSLYMIMASAPRRLRLASSTAPVRLLWLAAAILPTRCFFEAVMCPYYLAPPLFLALVMVARSNGRGSGRRCHRAGDIGLRLLPPQPVGLVVARGGRSRHRAGSRLPGGGSDRRRRGRSRANPTA